MTFNKMRFPIVWITLALCVVLCALEVDSGPVDHQDLRLLVANKDYTRSARQEPYDEDSGEENDDGGDEESDDDGDEDGGDDGDDDENEERSLKRHVREASQKPLVVIEQADEEDSDVIPAASTETPSSDTSTKKPSSSVLLLLGNALDKAISATTKLPSQQMASDVASVFLLLGQVFSEAIDKVIGEDGPDEAGATEVGIIDATEIPSAVEELVQLPINGQSVKVEKQPQINSSQSELKFPSS